MLRKQGCKRNRAVPIAFHKINAYLCPRASDSRCTRTKAKEAALPTLWLRTGQGDSRTILSQAWKCRPSLSFSTSPSLIFIPYLPPRGLRHKSLCYMNKKQKNWLAAALLGVVSLTTSAQEEGPSKLVVHFQEGATSEFALTDIQALTFGTESFSIALTNGTNQSDLAYEDVAKLTLGTGPVNGIASTHDEATGLSLYPTVAADKICVNGWNNAEQSTVTVYSTGGSLCIRIDNWSGQPLDVSSLPTGLYLLNINNQTLKFYKQ